MLWKAGCLTALAGLLLTVGSCFLFGNAARKAAAQRQVAEVEVPPGRQSQTRVLKAEPGRPARVDVVAVVELGEETLEEHAGEILQIEVPVSYEVITETEASLQIQAGRTGCSSILPRADSPHRDRFERRVPCTFQGKSFVAPENGRLWVEVEVPAMDDRGNPVREARVLLFDQLEEGAAGWAVGGALSLFAGPALTAVGGVLFLIGLIVASSKRSQRAPGGGPGSGPGGGPGPTPPPPPP